MVNDKTVQSRAKKLPLRAHARGMRHIPTDAEKKFWWQVRDRRLGGYKFKRQYPIGNYIADFVCLECHLIVELDGGQHAERADYDAARTKSLSDAGYRVMRFWNDEILTNMDGVIDGVLVALREPLSPSPASRN